jgi:hypothetical protein
MKDSVRRVFRAISPYLMPRRLNWYFIQQRSGGMGWSRDRFCAIIKAPFPLMRVFVVLQESGSVPALQFFSASSLDN